MRTSMPKYQHVHNLKIKMGALKKLGLGLTIEMVVLKKIMENQTKQKILREHWLCWTSSPSHTVMVSSTKIAPSWQKQLSGGLCLVVMDAIFHRRRHWQTIIYTVQTVLRKLNLWIKLLLTSLLGKSRHWLNESLVRRRMNMGHT